MCSSDADKAAARWLLTDDDSPPPLGAIEFRDRLWQEYLASNRRDIGTFEFIEARAREVLECE